MSMHLAQKYFSSRGINTTSVSEIAIVNITPVIVDEILASTS